MKKFILILIATICLCSCNADTKDDTHVETTQVIRCEDGVKIYVRKFTFENHQYLEFKDLRCYGHGFVHDPNCWCMIDYE